MQSEHVFMVIWFLSLVALFAALAWILSRVKIQIGTDVKASDMIDRWSKHARPTVGGIVFLIALIGWAVHYSIISDFSLSELVLLNCGILAFLLGLWDDLKRISASKKLIGQMVIAGIFAYFRFRTMDDAAETSSPAGAIQIVWFAIIFIVTVGMMNSVNMLDNMDGVSSIAAIPVLLIPVIAGYQGSVFSAIMLASLLGFLFLNWPKSKIFMGDSGSMLLGFIISWLLFEHYGHLTFVGGIFNLLIVLVASCSLYLCDTLVVVINRLRHGVSPATGGRDHSTHNLVYFGLSEKQVAFLFLALSTVQVFMLVVMHGLDAADAGQHNVIKMVFGYFFLLFVFFFSISVRNLMKGKYAYKK
jgi:UDP-GlcNAc:undecaprenyl-phosphate GlcNAc-1-phosphate transferase